MNVSGRPIGYTIATRQAEWEHALAMAGGALVLAISPTSIMFGGFQLLGTFGLGATTLSLLFGVLAALRVACLLANGHWSHGPNCRVVCAVIGAAIWLQMAYSLLAWSLHREYLSIGISIYMVLAIGEIVTLFRVVKDGRGT